MANLPEELITEILLILPVKSLLQFRDVLYHPEIGALFDLDYPCENRHDPPFLAGSVNGLVCLAFGLYDFFIWNPSIRKHMKLHSYGLNLISYFRESESPGGFKYGFGYDELQVDYKIVGVFPIYRNRLLYRVEVKLYSLRSDSWRCIDHFKGGDFLEVWGKFVNGKLHWLEEIWKISSIDLDVWVMKEYGVKESWTKMFTIKKSPVTFLLQFGSRLGKYNPKDDSIRYLDVTHLATYIEAELYVKSLVCPFYRRDHACNNNGGSNNADEDNRVTS
ncbi:hypothetical protein P3S68_023172 [Capsicum galapagoense]